MRKLIVIITSFISLFIRIDIFSNNQIIRDIDKLFLNAVKNENITELKDTLQKGANVNVILKEEGDFYGYNGLMIACYINSPLIVKLLIKRGADVNIKNQLDNTALKIAKTKGFNEIVDILIKAGAKE